MPQPAEPEPVESKATESKPEEVEPMQSESSAPKAAEPKSKELEPAGREDTPQLAGPELTEHKPEEPKFAESGDKPETAQPEPSTPKAAESEPEELKPAEDNGTWVSTTKNGKKGKKSKRGNGIATPANEPRTLMETEPTEATGDKVGRNLAMAPEPVDEKGAPKDESQEPPQAVEAPVDTCSLTTKKSKKGQSGCGTMAPTTSLSLSSQPTEGDAPANEVKDGASSAEEGGQCCSRH